MSSSSSASRCCLLCRPDSCSRRWTRSSWVSFTWGMVPLSPAAPAGMRCGDALPPLPGAHRPPLLSATQTRPRLPSPVRLRRGRGSVTAAGHGSEGGPGLGDPPVAQPGPARRSPCAAAAASLRCPGAGANPGANPGAGARSPPPRSACAEPGTAGPAEPRPQAAPRPQTTPYPQTTPRHRPRPAHGPRPKAGHAPIRPRPPLARHAPN